MVLCQQFLHVGVVELCGDSQFLSSLLERIDVLTDIDTGSKDGGNYMFQSVHTQKGSSFVYLLKLVWVALAQDRVDDGVDDVLNL